MGVRTYLGADFKKYGLWWLYISKVLPVVTLYIKGTRALTLENGSQV
jgi:hypothetical protein